jgi:hypothetical protein
MGVPVSSGRVLIAAGVVGCLLALGGCGEQGSDQPRPPEAIQPASDIVEPLPPAAQAKAAVRSYYREVNVGDYQGAWSHFTPDLRTSLGGFQAWQDGYSFTVNTQLASLWVVRSAPAEVVLGIDLVGDAIDACANDVSQTFEGTWTLDNIDGTFVGTALDVAQTGGGDIVTDPSACPPPPGPPPTVPPPTGPPPASDCDSNYSGACLDPNSSDYDCEGGTGNGPDYTGPVEVVGDDHYGLDANGDGLGCEDS